MNRRQGQSIGKDCYSQRYAVKIYDKGKQYQLSNDLLRIELKVIKMEQLKNVGIVTLADLLDIEKLKHLGSNLVAMFDEILYYDTSINLKELSRRERAIIMDGRNPAYWDDLKEQSPKTFDYRRNRFREITNKYSKEHQQKKISQLIADKWEKLINVEAETLAKLTAFLNQFPEHKFSQINTSYSGLIPSTLPPQQSASNKRYCKTCKRDITEQKESSLFCSSKYVGEDRSKQCRNQDSNPRNNRATAIDRVKKNPLLFEVEPYFKNRIIHEHYL
jgi:hypothetical protein